MRMRNSKVMVPCLQMAEKFEKGDYEYISGRLTYEELLAELGY